MDKILKEARSLKRLLVRLIILKKLGSKCAKCGYDKDYRVLQIDHIGGGGTKEKNNFTTNQYYTYLLNLDNETLLNKYQCLCANCNVIKKYNKSEDGSDNLDIKIKQTEVGVENAIIDILKEWSLKRGRHRWRWFDDENAICLICGQEVHSRIDWQVGRVPSCKEGFDSDNIKNIIPAWLSLNKIG